MDTTTQQMMSNTVMRNPRKVLLHFMALGLLPFCIMTAASAQTTEQIAKKALAATVYLEMTDTNGNTLGFGSGFFVGQSQIATNFHVIEGAAEGTAKRVGRPTKYTIEGISATDKKNDLTILKVTASGIKPLPLGNSDMVQIGETVYVAGNPKGLEGTFSNGIISNLRGGHTQKWIQITAPISSGSIGGSMLNGNGEVIKLDKAQRDLKKRETQGIPIGTATSNIISELILYEVDEVLRKSGYEFTRYIDDYECYCETREQAENFILILEQELRRYLLNLNASKVMIEELPIEFQDQWVIALRNPLPAKNEPSPRDIMDFLDFTKV